MSYFFGGSGGVPQGILPTFMGQQIIWNTEGSGGAGFQNAFYPTPNSSNQIVNTPFPSIGFGCVRLASNVLWHQLAPLSPRSYVWDNLDAHLSYYDGKGIEVFGGSSAFSPGWARTGTLVATAGVVAGGSTLTFASVPAWADYTTIPGAGPYGHGITITNLTNPGTIQASTSGVHGSNTGTTVNLSLPVVDGGVGGVQAGDVIQFLNIDKGQPPMRYQDLTDFIFDIYTHIKTTFPNISYRAEGYNEPVTGGNFFTGTMDELKAWQTAFYNGVKAFNATSVVHGPGLNYAGAAGGLPNIRIADSLVDFLSSTGPDAPGVASKIEKYGFHSYTSNANPETAFHDFNASPQSFNIPNMKSVLATAGMDTSPWSTEGSWGTFAGLGLGASQGTFDYIAHVARYHLDMLMEGVERVMWYSYDNPNWGQLWIPGTFYMQSVAVNNGGSGYVVGQLFNPTWMTTQYAPQLQVRTVNAGAVTSINTVSIGSTNISPGITNVATIPLSGTGTGLTVDMVIGTVGSNGLLPAGIAYGELYKWLVGATKISQAQGAVLWSVTLSRGTYQAIIMWNRNSSTTSFTVPAPYTQMRDLLGNTTTGVQGTNVSITGRPILLESFSAF